MAQAAFKLNSQKTDLDLRGPRGGGGVKAVNTSATPKQLVAGLNLSAPGETYYSSGRLESKTLASPDADGNIYYHYLDENFNSQGYGRVDKTIRSTPDSDGAISFILSYYGFGADKVVSSNETWSSGIYNFNSITVQTGQTLTINGPASIYINTPISGGGNIILQGGRIDIYGSLRINSLTTGGGVMVGLHASRASVVSEKKSYNDTNSTNLMVTYDYYDSSRMQSKTLVTSDANSNIYYHYIDENFNSQGYGRVDKTIRNTPDTDGAMSYTFSYYGSGIDKVISSNETWSSGTYNFNSITVQAGKTLTINGPASLYFNTPITGGGNIILQGGKIDIYGSISVHSLYAGADAPVTLHGSRASVVIEKKSYSDTNFTNLLVTYNYYNSSRMQSKTLATPDVNDVIYYHYLDENWNGQGYGRIDKTSLQIPLNGELVYTASGDLAYLGELSYSYTYYNDPTGRLKTKTAYSDSSWTTLLATYNYYNDSTNRVASKIDAGSGTTYTYYNDFFGYIESKTLASPDASGNIYYHYFNENWNSRGFGRVDQSIMQTPVNGELSYSYIYTNYYLARMQAKIAYSDVNWTTPVAMYVYYDDETNKDYAKDRVCRACSRRYDDHGNLR